MAKAVKPHILIKVYSDGGQWAIIVHDPWGGQAVKRIDRRGTFVPGDAEGLANAVVREALSWLPVE